MAAAVSTAFASIIILEKKITSNNNNHLIHGGAVHRTHTRQQYKLRMSAVSYLTVVGRAFVRSDRLFALASLSLCVRVNSI